jgi:hypothetical protein
MGSGDKSDKQFGLLALTVLRKHVEESRFPRLEYAKAHCEHPVKPVRQTLGEVVFRVLLAKLACEWAFPSLPPPWFGGLGGCRVHRHSTDHLSSDELKLSDND